MCALARAGKIQNLTGVEDPYESPLSPEIRTVTVGRTAEENAEIILSRLDVSGFVLPVVVPDG